MWGSHADEEEALPVTSCGPAVSTRQGKCVCRVLRELLGSALAARQGEPLQRKHLLSKALKRAHNSLGNHQLVSQARRKRAACDDSRLPPSSCLTTAPTRDLCIIAQAQGSSSDHMVMPGALSRSRAKIPQCLRQSQSRHGASEAVAVQVLNALAPCQQEQGDLSGAEAMLRSSIILAKHQQDLTSQVTSCQ